MARKDIVSKINEILNGSEYHLEMDCDDCYKVYVTRNGERITSTIHNSDGFSYRLPFIDVCGDSDLQCFLDISKWINNFIKLF